MAVRRRHETRSHDTVLLSHKLSEYHSGYRGFTCQVLKDPPLHAQFGNFRRSGCGYCGLLNYDTDRNR